LKPRSSPPQARVSTEQANSSRSFSRAPAGDQLRWRPVAACPRHRHVLRNARCEFIQPRRHVRRLGPHFGSLKNSAAASNKAQGIVNQALASRPPIIGKLGGDDDEGSPIEPNRAEASPAGVRFRSAGWKFPSSLRFCSGIPGRLHRAVDEGEALENYAVRNARWSAFAKSMPSVALRKRKGAIGDVALDDVEVGDTLVVYFMTSVRWMERWSTAMAS
jgi:hypothetical protein